MGKQFCSGNDEYTLFAFAIYSTCSKMLVDPTEILALVRTAFYLISSTNATDVK